MHGLINRSIEAFIAYTYGPETWAGIASAAELPATGFEPLQSYEDTVTARVLAAAADALQREQAAILEDAGHYLVTNPGLPAPRRLLRFGGDTFADFLHSLEDLHDRARLALPDLDLPRIEVTEDVPGRFTLRHAWAAGLGPMITGALRAMADDYGALALIEPGRGRRDDGQETISVRLLESDFAQGRDFSLGRLAP
ncbi:MAG: heme NO-binding domain-containing protein [Rhodobacteraceae bacterium]|jgi:hypothetical protein|nr:heme NO-binding domain-containing protein [Paracoccaceae bacterium]MBL4556584.1 heme NO-binding domain-containing protein [Paracoccaceae bacterium]HBH00041.1 heme NO-binding protein [Paracoccaceae bacterium]